MSDFNLELAIRSAFDASGIKASESAIESFTVHVNAAAASAKGAGGEQGKLAKEFGGSRGPVADFTRLLLQSVGATRQSGEVAKFAGAAMHGLGAAASGLTIGAAGFVAVAAFLLPKLVEMASGSGDAADQTKRLTDEVIEQLPQLEDLAEKIGNVNKAIQLQLEATRKQALDKQTETIAQYTRQIVELEQRASDLQIKIERVGFGLERAAPDSATSKKVDVYKEELRKLNSEIDRQSAVLLELQEAQEKGLTVERIRTGQTRDREKAERETEKAIAARRREEERLKKLQEDGIKAAFALRSEKAKEEQAAKKQHDDDLNRAAAFILSRQRERNADTENARAAVQTRREMNAEMVAISAAALATAVGAFTKNKAINIAAAIADTYAAAVKAYNTAGGGPWGIPILALTIAQGLAQVQQIRKSAPGFDDPVNDMLAESFGRKWAADFIAHVNAGFQKGLGSPTTYNNYHINRGTTVNLPGTHFIGSQTEFEKRLVRTLTHANRTERRTTS